MNITVLGLGHLGLVAAAGLACQGHVVTGLDIDNLRIEKLRNGLRPIYEPGLYEWLNEGVSGGRLKFLRLEEFRGDVGEVVLVATGTPAAAWGEADLLQVQTALRWVKGLRPTNTTVVMKSTVPPGSGRTFCQGELEGLDIEYVANPEFLREGGAVHDWMFPDRIVVGTVDASLRSANVVKRMYSGIEAPYLVTDITSAEMLKYASNAFLATRISFINEIASLCEKVGASIDAISEGLAMDVRMGPEIHAGIGYGGSCFPKDIRALEHLAAANGVQLDLLKSVTAINDRQRQLPLTRLRDRFGGNPGRTEGWCVGSCIQTSNQRCPGSRLFETDKCPG